MKFILRYLVSIYLISIQTSYGKIIRRYYFTGVLFEEYHLTSNYIDFADTEPEEWKNLTALAMKHGMKSKGVFCAQGQGAWIAYPYESFSHGSLSYHLIVGEHCIPVDKINSIQPIGYIYGMKHTGIAHFSEKYFESEGTIISNGSVTAKIKSFIYIGSEPWTFTAEGNSGPVKFCVVREPDIDKVCIITDLVSQMGLKSEDVTLEHECNSNDTKVEHYYLQNCYDTGVYTITHEFDLTVEPMKALCSGGDKPDEKDKVAAKFSALMEMWNARILYDAEEYGTIHGINPDAFFKVDFLMEIIDIFAQGCPRVFQHYLSILGNIFLMHLREVWKDETMIGKQDDTWMEVSDFISHCGFSMHSSDDPQKIGGHDYSLPMSCRPTEMAENPNEFERLSMELINQGDDFDMVIEQIWLILSFVAPYCSFIDGYKNNLWSDFPTLFKKHYLAPVEKQWMYPGDWQKFYASMFNGFDIGEQHQAIVACVQATFHVTPLFDPIGRTNGFDKYFWQYSHSDIMFGVASDETTKNATTQAGRSVPLKPGKKQEGKGRVVKEGKGRVKGKTISKAEGKPKGKTISKAEEKPKGKTILKKEEKSKGKSISKKEEKPKGKSISKKEEKSKGKTIFSKEKEKSKGRGIEDEKPDKNKKVKKSDKEKKGKAIQGKSAQNKRGAKPDMGQGFVPIGPATPRPLA